MTRVAVVVGVGVTGARVAGLLSAAAGTDVGVIDRHRDVADAVASSMGGAVLDLAHAEVADVVVLACPAPHAPLARRLLSAGVSVVSMSDEVDDVDALLRLGPVAATSAAVLVVGAAMAPGLSGLLARHLADQLDVVDEIHIAMHGTGGPACARQHHRALGGTSLGLHDGKWIRRPAGAGRELCWFPEPVNAYDCYRAEMPEPTLLHRAFPSVSRMTARVSGTRRDRLTARLPMLSPPHREGGVGAVRVEVRGALASGERETLIAGVAVRASVAASTVAATMALWVLDARPPAGAVVAGEARLPTADLLAAIKARGVMLHEFTGVARASTW